MPRSAHSPSQLAQRGAASGLRSRGEAVAAVTEVVAVPILSLRPGDSPRLGGLAAKTVATIRKRACKDGPASGARVGTDGKVRPPDSGDGRRRAAKLLARWLEAALRDVGRPAGIAAGGLAAMVLLCACHGTQTAAGLTGVRQSQAVNAGRYVALGDSYTSAPLVPDQDGIPVGCLRSSEDYPALVARALHTRSLTDVSCYGASTRNMTHSQDSLGQSSPPQLSAVSAADSLVTVQVGGNDVGFSRILATCGALSLTDPFGSPCRDHYTAGGTDQLAQAVSRTAPKVATVLRDVRERAPHARILLIGYPDILPASGSGCWPWVPVARGDVPYLRSVEISLNSMLAAVAARAGAEYVDAYRGTVGHDACQPAGVKWVEGLIPSSLAVPVHPNASGEQAMARLIVAAVR